MDRQTGARARPVMRPYINGQSNLAVSGIAANLLFCGKVKLYRVGYGSVG